MTPVMTMSATLRHEAVIKPLWYCGASTCFQTIRGSQALTMYPIWFMAPMTMARSSDE